MSIRLLPFWLNFPQIYSSEKFPFSESGLNDSVQQAVKCKLVFQPENWGQLLLLQPSNSIREWIVSSQLSDSSWVAPHSSETPVLRLLSSVPLLLWRNGAACLLLFPSLLLASSPCVFCMKVRRMFASNHHETGVSLLLGWWHAK